MAGLAQRNQPDTSPPIGASVTAFAQPIHQLTPRAQPLSSALVVVAHHLQAQCQAHGLHGLQDAILATFSTLAANSQETKHAQHRQKRAGARARRHAQRGCACCNAYRNTRARRSPGYGLHKALHQAKAGLCAAQGFNPTTSRVVPHGVFHSIY